MFFNQIIFLSAIIPINKHIVQNITIPIRLSSYCCNLFIQLPSLNSVKKAIKAGELLINGTKAQTGTWVNMGDVIELVDLERNIPKPFKMNIEMVYEDDDLVVVNKPPGISVSGNQFRTLENALIGNVTLSNKDNALKWARPVHRLDNPTSGLLIASKTKDAHIRLGEMFKNKEIDKEYHAIVMGLPPAEGKIDFLINGHQSVSYYKIIQSIPSLRSEHLSLLKLTPKTGRTHQLRIHCSQSGFPILGDKQYGEVGNVLLKDGLYLFASYLKFKHPITLELLEFELPIPHKFLKRLENEERRWKKYQE